MKISVAVSVAAVSILTTTLASAYYQEARIDMSPGSSTGYCALLESWMGWWDPSSLYVRGSIWKTNKINFCPSHQNETIGWAYTGQTVQYAIYYTLWKWDGTQQVVCRSSPDWQYITTYDGDSDLRITNLKGCGPGYYTARIQGYYFDGGWKGGEVYSTWEYFDLPNPPSCPYEACSPSGTCSQGFCDEVCCVLVR
jgi:hypothetical protein